MELSISEPQGARCAVASKAVYALCHRLERHAAAIILNMNKNKPRLCVCTARYGERCGRVVGVPRARREDAV